MENRSGVLGADRQNRQKRGALLLRLWRYLGRNRLLFGCCGGAFPGLQHFGPLWPPAGGPGHQRHCGGTRPGGSPLFGTGGQPGGGFYFFPACMSYTLSQVMIRLSRQVVRQMRRDVFENLARLPVGFFDRYQTGDILSVITYDVDTVNQSLSADLLQILQTVVTVTVSLGDDAVHCAEAGAHFLRHHSRHDILHPVHHRPGAAPLPAAKRRPGGSSMVLRRR